MSVGRRVRLVHGNDRAGTNSAPAGLEGAVSGKTAQGHYMIEFDDGKARCLGSWMLAAARDGKLEKLPLLNV